jgi:probable phosphoglycerate mutase
VSDRYPQRPFTPPPDATEIVLVRHGASQAAVPGERFELVEGHADPALSAEGEAQARAVCERLAADPPDAVFVTPLQRTTQTAAELLRRTGLEPVSVPDLREVRLGDWEGGELRIRAAQRDPRFLEMLELERWDVVPNAEPMDAFADRVRAGLRTVIETTGQGRVAVAFIHGGVIGELCRQATASRPFAFVHADNCSITRLVAFADGRMLLRSFNDTSHLAEVPAIAA